MIALKILKKIAAVLLIIAGLYLLFLEIGMMISESHLWSDPKAWIIGLLFVFISIIMICLGVKIF